MPIIEPIYTRSDRMNIPQGDQEKDNEQGADGEGNEGNYRNLEGFRNHLDVVVP